MANLKVIPLGGMGKVSQNMFVYQYQDEILIIDCGIGFPDIHTPGIDILIPDISYLQNEVTNGKKIVGLIFSHGHDDHIAALPYLIKDLPSFPILASPLTAAFATDRLSEVNAFPEIKIIEDKKWIQLGKNFKVIACAITHSVPDTKHFLLETPLGLIYHGSDFKLDAHPIDGVKSDLDFIGQYKGKVKLMLMDCLRVERDNWSVSEAIVGASLEEELKNTEGKLIVTLMSSHIHRIQQIVNLATKYNRKVSFVGRSVEKNVKAAIKLVKLKDPSQVIISRKRISKFQDKELILVVAGSQGQEGSSLVRAVYGFHPQIQIKKKDRVIFSADVIPGNELTFYQAIDELSINGVEVVYPDIKANIHASGHASSLEQQELLNLVKPEYVMPIGGANRHRSLFARKVAFNCGYKGQQVIIPKEGEIIYLENEKVFIKDKINLKPKLVDGLGIGDVGPIVISDRKILGTDGIMVILLKKNKNFIDPNFVEIISRGFIFMKESEDIVNFLKEKVKDIIFNLKDRKDADIEAEMEKRVAKNIHLLTGRAPMIYIKIID